MKNKYRPISLVLCTIVLIAGLFAFPKQSEAIPPFEEATIIANDVNMRLRPTVDSPFVLKLENGTRVGVFCEEIDGWYRIIYGNYRGYVSKDFVFLPSTDVLVGNINADETPVYQNAGEYSDVIYKLNAGTGISITTMQGDYYGIEYHENGQPAVSAVPEEAASQPAQPAQEESVQTEQAQTTEPAAADTANAPAQTQVEEKPAQTAAQDGAKRGYIKKDTVTLSASKNAASRIKEGMKGVEVLKMQRELQNRGFLTASATGEFGEQTKAAVVLFQERAGIAADGVAGAQTLELLYGDNNIKCTYAQRLGISGKVQLMPWSEADSFFYKECVATVTDVRTGISWKEKRFGGWFHADSEPLTAEDTAKMKEAYGGSWSWDRRAIWVTIDGVTAAASMNGMPHMVSTTGGNNFPGHHCIHFYQSKVHENSKECPRHQAEVQYSYKMGTE